MAALQFVAFETALRVHGGSEAAPAFRRLFLPDDYIGHRLSPGVRIRFTTSEFSTDIAINAQGVRDNEPIGPKARDERRVVVLGDSIVLAVQVEAAETFCERLEAHLNARGDGWRYRVINAGVQGYGPIEELRFFERIAAKFEPDLVLLATFVANDAVEVFDRTAQLQATRTVVGEVQDEAGRRLRRLVRRSMVLQIVTQRVRSITERLHPGRRPAPDRRLLSYSTPLHADVQRGFELGADVARQIAERARAAGARTAIVLVPARFQLDDAEYDRLRATVEPAGYEMTIDGANDRFAAAYAPLGLPVLDLLPAFRLADRPGAIFYRRTVHLTPYGHRVAAGALARFLDARQLP